MLRGAALTAASVVVGVSACTLPLGQDDPTTSTSTTTDLDIDRAGRQLTDDELDTAVGDGPDGWRSVVPDSTVYRWRKTDPPECADVLKLGEPAKDLRRHEQGSLERGWRTPLGAAPGMSLFVQVRTYDRPVGPELLDAAGEALGSCEAFALTGQGMDMRVLAASLSFPGLGEQTFPVQVTTWDLVDDRSQAFYVSYATVRVGHNLVIGSVTSSDPDADLSVLESQTREVLRRLET